MTKRSAWSRVAVTLIPGLAAAVLMAACASPPQHYYLLAGSDDPPPAIACQRQTILVDPVTIPQEDDRPQVLIREGSDTVSLSEQQRWATPLKDAVAHLLAAQLSRSLPEYRFVTRDSSAAALAVGSLAVDVTRFDAFRTERRDVVAAHWVYRVSGSPRAPLQGDALAQVVIAGRSFEAIVGGLRGATAEVAHRVAQELRRDGALSSRTTPSGTARSATWSSRC
jgi:uncharacterized protein